ncbi:MAG: tRNA (N(6)-L-threonylcarbamoyladenosine(37)-C(2))-methylthiotransferase MtaB [Bacilli bacterium]|nr:tRNA (N(6)-L-threonylcarbamoyladenosine(37)-C(2))-methylthiotransferase MtaB [Bacilli bacterium]
MNSYENAALGTELSREGWTRVSSFSDADLIILNTCSVTGRADQKSRQHISSFRKGNSCAIIVAMGCYTQTHAEQAASLGANIVLGAADRALVLKYIEEFKRDGKTIIDIKKNIRHESYEEFGETAFCDNVRAYLKVQDGCDNFCSYCFIPFLRGNSRSREPRNVVREAQMLCEKGYPEIVITGIHIGGYGKDLADGAYRLSDLLENILLKCPTLPRLRVSSIEESEIDDKFLDLLRRFPTIADHLHIPLQSGSANVLKAMKRKYDTKAFLDKLQAIRAVRPDIAITTDVIAGFPGETEEEWRETMEFCAQAAFAEIHVFPFSPRPGTYAARLKDTDAAVKKARVHELLALSKKMRSEYEARFYGKKMPVLFEQYDAQKHCAYGHSSNYLLVAIPAEKPLDGTIEEITYNSSVASD